MYAIRSYYASKQHYLLGNWRVDPEGGQIAREGAALHLEPKVMEVLTYLVDHRGQLVTREALERDVWRGALVGYDSVTGTIIKLRKALGDDAHDPRYIETLPVITSYSIHYTKLYEILAGAPKHLVDLTEKFPEDRLPKRW